VNPELTGLVNGHGIGWGGSLEADGEEDDLARWVGLGDPEAIQRGIDDPHVGSFGLQKRSVREPGTRSISPNEQKRTSGCAAMAWALSIISKGVTQTGQPGPCTNSTPGVGDSRCHV
jgi:hypothetical protein